MKAMGLMKTLFTKRCEAQSRKAELHAEFDHILMRMLARTRKRKG